MAFTSIAALVGGQAVTATLVLGAIAEVGLAMTVIGGVTGSKDLMKIGGAMSLIGGVGGMIAGATSGAAAAGAGELGSSAVGGLGDIAADSALNASAGALESGVAPALDAGLQAGGAELAAGAMPDLATAMNPTDMRLAAGTQASPSLPIADAMGSAPTVNDIATPGAPQGPAGAQGPATPYDNPTDMRLAAGKQGSPLAPEGSGSFFGKFSSWAEKNPTLFKTGTNFLTGALNGANQSSMWNQRMGIEQQRVNQTSHGSQVANFAPRGIIAGARA